MRKLLGLLVIIGMVGFVLGWQLAGQESNAPRPEGWRFAPPDPGAVPVTTDNRMSGVYPVGSRLPDRKALGGFGGCDNFPLDLGNNAWGEKGKLSLVVDPEEAVAYFKFRGVAVRLVNRTAEVKEFTACDSRLYLVQEAQDEQGKWCEIEELPQTFCGNSFHRVFLKPGQYWEIKARAYQGAMKTKLRFRLDTAGENDGGQQVYSREFDGQITKTQLRRGPSRAEVRRAIGGNDPKVALATLIGVLKAAENNPQIGEVRAAALQLGSMGPGAKEAIPALHALMKLDHFRAAAAYAAFQIEGLTPEQMKALRTELNDRSKVSWASEAARFLGEIGPPAAEATPDLAAALAYEDPTPATAHQLPSAAAEALGKIHSQPAVAVPALIRVLQKGDWYMQGVASDALAEFGAEAKAAVPQLIKTIEKAERSADVHAANALWRIQGKDDPATAEIAIGALRKAVTSEDYMSSWSAAWRLGEIGPPAKAAVPELTGAVKKHSDTTYACSLWKISGKPEPSRTALIKAISGNVDLSNSQTHYALEGLAAMRPLARPALPALIELHRRADAYHREQIQQFVAKIDPETAKKMGK